MDFGAPFSRPVEKGVLSRSGEGDSDDEVRLEKAGIFRILDEEEM
jgi:hypothetical protein